MRRLSAAITVLAIAATLHVSTSPVAACSCYMGTTAESLEEAAVVVLGSTGVANEAPILAGEPLRFQQTFHVERYLKGSGPSDIVITGYALSDPSRQLPTPGPCASFGPLAEGERHLFSFREATGPFFWPTACLLNGHFDASQDYVRARAAQVLAEVEAITGPGALPNGGGLPVQTGGSPAREVAPISIIIGGVLILGAVYALGRVRLR